MSLFEVIKGDLFAAIDGSKKIIIPHCCNDIGAWGAGFVLSISKYDIAAEEAYKLWFTETVYRPSGLRITNVSPNLGETQFVTIKNNANIANMIGQRGIYSYGGVPPVRYWALAKCMMQVTDEVRNKEIDELWTVRFGSGLAKGNSRFIETLMKEIWVDEGIPVKVFER